MRYVLLMLLDYSTLKENLTFNYFIFIAIYSVARSSFRDVQMPIYIMIGPEICLPVSYSLWA